MPAAVSLKRGGGHFKNMSPRAHEKALCAYLESKDISGSFKGYFEPKDDGSRGSSWRQQQGVIPRLLKGDAISFYVQPGGNDTCFRILLHFRSEAEAKEVFEMLQAKSPAEPAAPDQPSGPAEPSADETDIQKLDTGAILDDPDKLGYLLESLYELLEKDGEREFVTGLFRDHLIKFEVIGPEVNLRQVGQLAKAMAARGLLVRKGSGRYQLTPQAVGIIQPARPEPLPVEDLEDLGSLIKFVERIKALKRELSEGETRQKILATEVMELEGQMADKRQEQAELETKLAELRRQLDAPHIRERVEKIHSLLDELKQ